MNVTMHTYNRDDNDGDIRNHRVDDDSDDNDDDDDKFDGEYFRGMLVAP